MSAGTITRDGPPPTFTLFPNVPAELQIKIWRCALPGPRIIQLHYLNGSFSFHGARPPPALHTCRTSREAALSVFEPAFTRNNKLAPIYIDLAHDTLHLATEPGMFAHTAGSFPDIKKKIQSLAVEISSNEDLETVLFDIKRSSPSNLREIILVVGHTERLLEFKCAEQVRFSEPDASSRLPWQTWKGWTEAF
jgi:hypothetical protein